MAHPFTRAWFGLLGARCSRDTKEGDATNRRSGARFTGATDGCRLELRLVGRLDRQRTAERRIAIDAAQPRRPAIAVDTQGQGLRLAGPQPGCGRRAAAQLPIRPPDGRPGRPSVLGADTTPRPLDARAARPCLHAAGTHSFPLALPLPLPLLLPGGHKLRPCAWPLFRSGGPSTRSSWSIGRFTEAGKCLCLRSTASNTRQSCLQELDSAGLSCGRARTAMSAGPPGIRPGADLMKHLALEIPRELTAVPCSSVHCRPA